MAGRRPSLAVISGEDLEIYCRLLSALISSGRLNSSYPDPYSCSALVSCLAPSFRAGVYDSVCADAAAGMPLLKDVLAVKIDRDLAPGFLAEEGARSASGRTLAGRAVAKLAYLKRLQCVDLKPLHRVETRLRRVDRGRGTASFEVVYDAYAFAPACFARYRILLEQRDKVWASSFLERSGDYTEPTAEFRARLEKYAQDESELLFLILGGIPGVRVEEISRSRIGPFWNAFTGFPADWGEERGRGCAVLHFPVDKASVELKADINNDPFEGMFREFLTGEAKDLVEERMRGLGYRVHKDRKFSCTKAAEPALRRMLGAGAARTIIYAI